MFLFRRRRPQKNANKRRRIAGTATPTAIPAFAPVARPPFEWWPTAIEATKDGVVPVGATSIVVRELERVNVVSISVIVVVLYVEDEDEGFSILSVFVVDG